MLHLAAFDWNCPQHITPRFSEAELAPALAPLRSRLEALESENRALRARLARERRLRVETTDRPPLPPFSPETAAQKVRLAEDAWNTRDPARVSLAYTIDSKWRNRVEFIDGREAIRAFLTRKWNKELDYRLIKELWGFRENRMAVRFAYEWHDDSGQWFRSYGNELWEFDEHGLMRRRVASINDLPIADNGPKIFLARRAASGRASRADRVGALEQIDVWVEQGCHCERSRSNAGIVEQSCGRGIVSVVASVARSLDTRIQRAMKSRDRLLRHDLRSHPAVEQPFQVILRERVRRAFAHQRGEGGERGWIARLELGEGVGIGSPRDFALSSAGSGSNTRIGSLRPRSMRSPTGRPTKPSRALGGGGADADARAELLVDRFEPRRGVDGVAIGRVVEQPPAAEIADDRRSRMNADAGDAERHAARFPFQAVVLRRERRARARRRSPGLRRRADRRARRTAHGSHRR